MSFLGCDCNEAQRRVLGLGDAPPELTVDPNAIPPDQATYDPGLVYVPSDVSSPSSPINGASSAVPYNPNLTYMPAKPAPSGYAYNSQGILVSSPGVLASAANFFGGSSIIPGTPNSTVILGGLAVVALFTALSGPGGKRRR